MQGVTIKSESYSYSDAPNHEEKRANRSRVWFIASKRFRAVVGQKKLGFIWLLLDPVLMSSVYLFVFTVLRASVSGESIFIGISLIRIFQVSIKSGLNAVNDFSGGIKAERIRTEVLTNSMIFFRSTDTLFQSLGTVIILLLAYKISITGLLMFIILAQILGILSEGIGLNLALVSRRIPDIAAAVNYILMLMFFGSPALYPLSVTTGLHREVNEWNPFTYFAESARYFANLDTSIGDIDPAITTGVLLFCVILSIRGYAQIDNIRWRVSNW
tara:strand:- start:278 stop:1093 length:816 start_codon:yes stop_codon:yes gene_type:complete